MIYIARRPLTYARSRMPRYISILSFIMLTGVLDRVLRMTMLISTVLIYQTRELRETSQTAQKTRSSLQVRICVSSRSTGSLTSTDAFIAQERVLSVSFKAEQRKSSAFSSFFTVLLLSSSRRCDLYDTLIYQDSDGNLDPNGSVSLSTYISQGFSTNSQRRSDDRWKV